MKAFIKVNDLSLAYTITHPEKETSIFFIHGNSTSSSTWRKQVASDALTNYRLITIDLPNHGSSDAIDTHADFSLPAIAKIVGQAVKQLNNNRPFIICAVSLGTNIVVEMLKNDLKVKGLFLAGPCIIGEDFGLDKMVLEGADVSAVFAEDLPEQLVLQYAFSASISKDEKDIQAFLFDYNAVKGKFRSSLYATIAAGIYNDEIAILQKNNCPVCIVFGKDEKIVNTKYLNDAPFNIWNKTIYKTPGAGHLVNIDAAEDFNKLLAEFAEQMFTIK